MSEEKPTFKITDRRLFNSDGSPRDIEREDAPAETPIIGATTPTASAASTPTAAQTPRAAATPEMLPKSQSTVAQSAPDVSRGEDVPNESSDEFSDEMPEQLSPDSTPFVNLLMFVASPAAAALGLTEHPSLPPGEVDLPLAKHCIDLLGTLGEKTRGNLSTQEQQVFEGLLAELRMQFVSLTNAPRNVAGKQNFGGGFSGGDITGGR